MSNLVGSVGSVCRLSQLSQLPCLSVCRFVGWNKIFNNQEAKAMTTTILIINTDQGWTVPSIIGVDISKKIRHISISRVMRVPLWLLVAGSWFLVVGC